MINVTNEFEYRQLSFEACWHLAYYIPEKQAPGTLASAIINFKNNVNGAVQSWLPWVKEEIENTGIQFDVIIRALGSKETGPSGTKASDALGKQLAAHLGAKYEPELLAKTRKTEPLHFVGGYFARKAEIANVYYVKNTGVDLDDKRVLIFDDISTTSATIQEIERALREEWPKIKLYLFCIGRTSHDPAANDAIVSKLT